MLNKEIKYSLNDVVIQPITTSFISSRSECDPYYENDMLPLFTAPMSSVVDVSNYKKFLEHGINPIIPRTVDFSKRLELCTKGNLWVAFSIREFENTFVANPASVDTIKKFALIDIANGHMNKLLDIISKAKKMHGNKLTIMAGNIANPETYKTLSSASADYIRIGIGGGGGCLTASNTGIFYPMASLISECKAINCFNNCAKIVVDGGIKGYADIIKALALGADYVMCGTIFGKMIESSAPIFIRKWDGIVPGYGALCFTDTINIVNDDTDLQKSLLLAGAPLFKNFYGMSTKKVQRIMGNTSLKTSEGKYCEIPVEYSMRQWVENFSDYLKSAMSYTGHKTLKDFKTLTNLNVISNNASNSYNK